MMKFLVILIEFMTILLEAESETHVVFRLCFELHNKNSHNRVHAPKNSC